MKKNVISRIRNGDESILKEIYVQYRDGFTRWLINRYNSSEEDAREIFQLAVVIFYDNIITGQLSELNCSVKTYLYSIGKNKMRDLQRRKKKVTDPLIDIIDERNSDLDQKEQFEETMIRVEASMNKLGYPCQELLELFYYHNMTIEQITTHFNYKNRDSAKNQKYKCLQRLKKLVLSEVTERINE